jgi:hypothetical protein
MQCSNDALATKLVDKHYTEVSEAVRTLLENIHESFNFPSPGVKNFF